MVVWLIFSPDWFFGEKFLSLNIFWILWCLVTVYIYVDLSRWPSIESPDCIEIIKQKLANIWVESTLEMTLEWWTSNWEILLKTRCVSARDFTGNMILILSDNFDQPNKSIFLLVKNRPTLTPTTWAMPHGSKTAFVFSSCLFPILVITPIQKTSLQDAAFAYVMCIVYSLNDTFFFRNFLFVNTVRGWNFQIFVQKLRGMFPI